jgi:hypothetical protein
MLEDENPGPALRDRSGARSADNAAADYYDVGGMRRLNSRFGQQVIGFGFGFG